MKHNVPVKILREGATLPTYGTEFSAGADLYACLDAPVTIDPACTVLVPTGLSLAIPEGFAGLIYARSGLATKRGLAPANKVGVIDSDYRGEIGVGLHNTSDADYTVNPGDRIAQLMITPVIRPTVTLVDELPASERGAGGFGSTGR